MSSIKLKNVSKNYEESRILLNKINLLFESGKRYAILGKSGCGKTTLLNIIGGIDTNYEGEILFNGMNIKDLYDLDNRFYKASIISYIHSEPIVFPRLTIKENLLIPTLLTESHDTSYSLGEIPHQNKTKMFKLSGGEQKRVNIIQGISKECQIVLADEPTANLDIVNSEIFMNKLIEFCKDKILIFVTHDKTIAEKYSDHILLIENSKIKKNYVNRKRIESINDSNVLPLSKNKASSAAKVFTKSESKQSNKLINASITTLLTASIALSIAIGIKEYFEDSINNATDNTYLSISKSSDFLDTNLNSHSNLSSSFEYCFDYFYDSQNETMKLNNNDFIIPYNSIDKPFETASELSENELILCINDDYKLYIETMLNAESIEDYMLDNDLYLFNSINQINYKITDIFYNNESYLKIYSSNANEYKNFHNENEKSCIAYKAEDETETMESFLNESTSYFPVKYNEYILIKESDENVVSYSYLKSLSDQIIPLSNTENNWIWYYDNILYFNNCKLYSEYTELDSIVYFSPYFEQLKTGRYPENNDEILVSSAIYNKLSLTGIYPEISIHFSNLEHTFKVVGQIDNDSCYIYANPSWAYDNLIDYYNIKEYLLKTTDYIIIDTPKNIIELETVLNTSIDSINTYSPINETYTSISSISEKIILATSIITLLLTIIAIFSTCILQHIEIDNYNKQTQFMKGTGLTNNDLNSIYLRIIIKRCFQCIILVCCLHFIFVKLCNIGISVGGLFGDNLLSTNPIIYISIILITIIIYACCYFMCKLDKRKTPA